MPVLPNPFQGWDMPQEQYDRAFAAFDGDVNTFRLEMKYALRRLVIRRERDKAMQQLDGDMDIGLPPGGSE